MATIKAAWMVLLAYLVVVGLIIRASNPHQRRRRSLPLVQQPRCTTIPCQERPPHHLSSHLWTLRIKETAIVPPHMNHGSMLHGTFPGTCPCTMHRLKSWCGPHGTSQKKGGVLKATSHQPVLSVTGLRPH